MTDTPREHPHDAPRRARPHASRPLLLCGARLTDGRTVDVRLSGARIEAVGTAGSLTPADAGGKAGPGCRGGQGGRDGRGDQGGQGGQGGRSGQGTTAASPDRVDLRGYLLLPAPAEPHAHLDQALTAAGPPPGEVAEIQRRATEAALLQLAHGATVLRTHVRIGDVQGLRALEAVLQARQSLRGLVDVQAVAVPRLLTGAPGADGLAMLRDAMKMGASVAGGCPDLDPDPSGYAEAVLSLAAEFGAPVDLHTAGGDPARLARLAAMAGGLRPGVTLTPCHGLAALPAREAARAADRLAAAGVSVTALPQGGCGALDRTGPGAGVAPVRLLRSAGVRVAAGSGALGDLANPVGRGDPLEAAFLLATHGACDAARAYDAVSGQARAVLGLPEVRVEAGFPAELLAVRGGSVAGVLSLGYSRIVIHGGRVVSRTSAVREFCDPAGPAAAPGTPSDPYGDPPPGLPRQAHREA